MAAFQFQDVNNMNSDEFNNFIRAVSQTSSVNLVPILDHVPPIPVPMVYTQQTHTEEDFVIGGSSCKNVNDEVQDENSDFDEELIDFVKEYKILWNVGGRGWKLMDRKNNTWVEIATNMNRDVEVLKNRWKNIKDGFTKCCKKIQDSLKSGAGASKLPTCKNYESLLFLKDNVTNSKNTTSNLSMNISMASDLDENEENEEQGSIDETQSLSSNMKNKGKRKRTDDRQESLDIMLMKALKEENNKENREDTSDMLFAKSIVPILEALPPKKKQES